MRYHRITLCVEIIVGSVSNTEPQTEQKHDTPTKEIPPNNNLPENNVVPKTDNNPPLEKKKFSYLTNVKVIRHSKRSNLKKH